jgi:secernin
MITWCSAVTPSINLAPGCDTVVVLAPHTRHGATMLAKNSDRPPLECQPLFHAPRRKHRTGATVHCQYLEIPQAAETAALIGSRPWWLWGFEHGVNEHGVAIGNEAVLTREELPATGLLGMDLVRLGLERGRNAREATAVIGALIERYGQGGAAAHDFDFRYSGGFIIADPHEAWVLESSGHQWAARKVRERASISNRITTNCAYDLASPDVRDYAQNRGWWDGASEFDFAAVYAGDRDADPLAARGRLARSHELAARRGKRTLREMIAMLRDHYERGEMPIIDAPPGSEKCFSLCMHNASATTASMVAELAPAQSEDPTVMWACLAAPCTGIYFPLYPAAPMPQILATGGERSSAQSPWWRMKRIQDLVAADPERLAPMVWKHFRPLENAIFEHASELALKLRTRKPADRGKLLATFMTQNVVRVMKEAQKVETELLRHAPVITRAAAK